MKFETMGVVESTDIVDLGVVLERELMECRKKCADLELEMIQKNSEFDCLEKKFRDAVVENLAVKEEVGVLKKMYVELEKRIPCSGNDKVDIGKEDVQEKVLKLMFENEIFECRQKKAESEVEIWKAKFEALESRVMELEGGNKEYNLVGKVKSDIGLSGIGVKEMSEVGGLKDGSPVLTCSMHIQAERAVRNSRETMHSVASKITIPQNFVKGTKSFHVSGDTLSTETHCKHWMHDESAEQGNLPGTETVSHVRKQLTYGEGSPSKKMAPSTPGGVKCAPAGVIDISDSDDEHVLTPKNQDNKTVSTDPVGGNSNIKDCASENKIEEAFLDQSDDEDMVGDQGSSPLNATRKRRRASNIVNSDSENDVLNGDLKSDTRTESVTKLQSNSSPLHATISGNNVHKTTSKRRLVTLGNAVSTPKRNGESNIVNSDVGSEDDDDVPISKLVTNRGSVPAAVSENRVPESLSRRRLASLRKFDENCVQKSSNTRSTLTTVEKSCQRGISREDDGEDEENESESEGESLGGFIVDGSDICENSGSDDISSIKSDGGNSLSRNSDHDEASGDSENTSGDDINYGEIISKLRRSRDNHSSKWEFEADMLADFGKDPQLCMKAVCALYRQQTSEEQSSKGTIYRNQRGFSHCDAYRGTSLAEFLTNGYGGDLRKSVEELKQYSAKGIELCRELANRYSKQLFASYKNKEDPFFLPDEVRD